MAKKLKSLVKPVTTPRPHAKLPKLSNEKVTSTNLRNKKAKAKKAEAKAKLERYTNKLYKIKAEIEDRDKGPRRNKKNDLKQLEAKKAAHIRTKPN